MSIFRYFFIRKSVFIVVSSMILSQLWSYCLVTTHIWTTTTTHELGRYQRFLEVEEKSRKVLDWANLPLNVKLCPLSTYLYHLYFYSKLFTSSDQGTLQVGERFQLCEELLIHQIYSWKAWNVLFHVPLWLLSAAVV